MRLFEAATIGLPVYADSNLAPGTILLPGQHDCGEAILCHSLGDFRRRLDAEVAERDGDITERDREFLRQLGITNEEPA